MAPLYFCEPVEERAVKIWCLGFLLLKTVIPSKYANDQEMQQIGENILYLSLKRLEKDVLLSDFSMSFLQCFA